MSVFLVGKDALSAGLRSEATELRLQTTSVNPQFTASVTSSDFTIDAQGRLRLAAPIQFAITGISSSTTFTRVTILGDPTDPQNEMVELTLDTPVTFTTNGTLTLNNINVDYQ